MSEQHNEIEIDPIEPIFIGIDTGTKESALVALQGQQILDKQFKPNMSLIDDIVKLSLNGNAILAIEMFEGRGQIAGQSSYDSIFIGGLYARAWIERNDNTPILIYRREVKTALCGVSGVNDANIRRAILDRFPSVGGGAVPQVGIKKQPGPLYGISKHLWSALAVSITAQMGEYGKCRILAGHPNKSGARDAPLGPLGKEVRQGNLTS